ncbi:MAG: dTDP-4-dehydrorhamnose reductase [Beijerinckiaceae bacterium]
MRRPILIIGAKGQLGQELFAEAQRRDLAAIAIGREELDITRAEDVRRVVADSAPRLIVNAAAFTAVDKAESEPSAAQAANVLGPENLARAAAAANIPLLHVSTDYVFDGTKIGAYREEDPIAPLGVYGRTKAEGEARVRAATERHIILRTSWVYGVYGGNFLKTMLRLSRERDELRVVADQRGCPTATLDIACAILTVDAALAAGITSWGTYHFASTGATTWHGFATKIVAAASNATKRSVPIYAIETKDYPTPARRPANSELDSTRFATIFGYRAAPWQQRTREVVEELLEKSEAR